MRPPKAHFSVLRRPVPLNDIAHSSSAKSYVAVTSGTCQSAGHSLLTTDVDCIAAALALGYKQDWGPHGGWADVVDGCSVRFGSNLFLNPQGTCVVGSTAPTWIPGLNGKADCQCSTYQPCLCSASGNAARIDVPSPCEDRHPHSPSEVSLRAQLCCKVMKV